MAEIMDGRKLSEIIRKKVKKEVKTLKKFGIDVGLGLMIAGNNPASKQYLKATLSGCKKVGITPFEYYLPETVSINEILNTIGSINRDERINGLLVLLPLPPENQLQEGGQ